MAITQVYRDRFAAFLAAAKLDIIDPRITPEEVRRLGRHPGTLVHGLYICANSSLDFRFHDWHTLLAFGSRSVTDGLMPTFRRRTDGRALELSISYDLNEPIDSGYAIIVHQSTVRSH